MGGRLSPRGSPSPGSPRGWSPSLGGGGTPEQNVGIGRLSPTLAGMVRPLPMVAAGVRSRVVRKPAALKAILKTLTIIIVIMFGRMATNGMGRGSGGGVEEMVEGGDWVGSVEIDGDGNVRTLEVSENGTGVGGYGGVMVEEEA